MADAIKETKAQRVERLKREKNPWEGLDEIRRFAREGFNAIPPEWIGTYFRWWGVYTQGDGAGVVGGENGEGKALPYFMVRIRIPNGLLQSHQLRTIADLTQKYARGIADITVRQNIQLHWVTIEALPEVMEALWRCGLNTLGACGDVTRNVTGCPVAGVDADEIVDASPLASKLRGCWPETRISTTCRASSRSQSLVAARGALIPRSTTLALPPSLAPCVEAWKPGFRFELEADSRPSRIWPHGLTPLWVGNRFCLRSKVSPNSFASATYCENTASARG